MEGRGGEREGEETRNLASMCDLMYGK